MEIKKDYTAIKQYCIDIVIQQGAATDAAAVVIEADKIFKYMILDVE